MQHLTDSREYHRALVSDKRRIGRGILAIVFLLLAGMAVFALVLTTSAAFLESVLGIESRPGFTPIVLGAGMLSVGLLIPWSMLIQKWLYGVSGASLSSVFSRFRFDVFGRALVVLVPATIVIQVIQYWFPFTRTTWAWHETLILLATAIDISALLPAVLVAGAVAVVAIRSRRTGTVVAAEDRELELEPESMGARP